jgi:lipid-A-disaccharide synthase
MKPTTFMLIAGEASGDLLAAELVSALRGKLPDATFFGAGGAKMSAAGVELAFDLTQHSVIGLTDVLKNYFTFRRLFNQLLALAIERKPDVVIGVDYGGFNLRFGQAVKKYVRENPSSEWNPKIVQFVSPQVWASRPGRADKLARDYDLLLSIFPFEKAWYAKRVPQLRVEFVGNPLVERFEKEQNQKLNPLFWTKPGSTTELFAVSPGDFVTVDSKGYSPPPERINKKLVVLLPGSRRGELFRHTAEMLSAAEILEKSTSCFFRIVLPTESLAHYVAGFELAEYMIENRRALEIHVGGLAQSLKEADVAIASTGTVTMECAFFGVPTVTLYKTSWLTYQIARRIITVKSLTMPNLLAGETVYPEFVQHDATPQNLARAALQLLQDESRRTQIKAQLAKIISSLGEPGAANRAAAAILSLFP